MCNSRTWNNSAYRITAALAFELLGPYNTWTKKVKISKKNGEEMACRPTGPEHMADEDIKAAWSLIHTATSQVCRAHGLNAPVSEAACYMPLTWVMQSTPGTFNVAKRIKTGLGFLSFALFAVEEGLITMDEYEHYVNQIKDAVK